MNDFVSSDLRISPPIPRHATASREVTNGNVYTINKA